MGESKKKSFILFAEYQEVFETLSDEDAGKLIKAIYKYEETGEVPELSPILKIALIPIKARLDENRDKYEAKCEQNKQSGAKGGRPKKADGSEKNRTVFEESERFSKNLDTDYDTDYDTDLKKEVVEEKKPTTANWVSCYENNIGLISPIVFEQIESYELEDEVVQEAITEAVNSDVRKPNYIYAILQECKDKNIHTAEQFKARKIEHEKNKPKKPPDKLRNAYVNPEQKGDYENLDRFYAN